MPLTILYRGQIVGMTELEFPLDAPHAIGGRFVPGPALDQVWAAFDLYERVRSGERDAIDRFVQARDALKLRLIDREGHPVAGQVDLISRWEDGRWVVHLSLG